MYSLFLGIILMTSVADPDLIIIINVQKKLSEEGRCKNYCSSSSPLAQIQMLLKFQLPAAAEDEVEVSPSCSVLQEFFFGPLNVYEFFFRQWSCARNIFSYRFACRIFFSKSSTPSQKLNGSPLKANFKIPDNFSECLSCRLPGISAPNFTIIDVIPPID